jgi:hypothetical protein
MFVDDVLEQEDGDGVSRILMGFDSEILGKDLQHSELSKHDIMGTFQYPMTNDQVSEDSDNQW